MPDNFLTFKSKIERLVFPGGLAKPLQFQFEQDIIQGLIDIQRWVKYFRSRNKDVSAFCATYFACGATVVDLPRGRIQRVYTLDGTNLCCPVFYTFEEDYDRFINWLNLTRKAWTEPENDGMPELPAPFKFAESVTDKGTRFNYGYWTINNRRIYLGQRIESTESVVVEWEGIRRKYEDATLMPYDDPDPEAGDPQDSDDAGTELLNVVASYVRSEDLRKNRRDIPGWQAELAVYRDMRADLMHESWAEETPKPVATGEMPFDQLNVNGTCGDLPCRDEEEA